MTSHKFQTFLEAIGTNCVIQFYEGEGVVSIDMILLQKVAFSTHECVSVFSLILVDEL